MNALQSGYASVRARLRWFSAVCATVVCALTVCRQDSAAATVPASDGGGVGEILTQYRIALSTGEILPGTTDIGVHCDDCAIPMVLPFPVTLYGQSFTNARISSNGALEFGSSSSDYNNICLPSQNYAYSIIPHWDDLRTDLTGSGVFTAIFGSAPNRVFVVEWRSRYYGVSTKVANFEVVLFENRPVFEIIYGVIEQRGQGATVGVQQDAANYTQFSCNQEVIMAGKRLIFGGLGVVTTNDSSTIPVNTGSVAIDVLANDVDLNGYGLRISEVTAAANGFVSIPADGSSLSYAPVAEFIGVDSFTYTVTNVFGRSATATVTVEVVNHDPAARDDAAATTEDTPVTVSVLANDDFAPDFSETLQVISAAGATHGALAYAPASVTYTPAPNYYGPDSFSYTISDGHGGTASARVSVVVTPANDNPFAGNDIAAVDQRSSVTIDVLANDTGAPDVGETLSIVAVGAAANGSIQFSENSITYTPAASFYGTDAFTYTISDGNGGSASASVTVTVRRVNSPPQVVLASPASLQLNEGDQFTLVGNIIDPDPADTHTVRIDWGDGSPSTTIQLATGLRDFSASHVFVDNLPAGTAFGSIVATVTDAYGESSAATQQITIANVAPLNLATSELTATMVVGTTASVTVQFSDPGAIDTHEVRFVWGDGSPDTVISSGGYVRQATHLYGAAGIFAYHVVVTDKDGGVASSSPRQVVVFDPNGGFLTGGGWIQVPASSPVLNVSAGAKLSFTLDVSYQQSTVPQGEVFVSVSNLNLVSTALYWLVTSRTTADVAGRATINGTGDYTFRIACLDGDATASVDRLGVQIWNTATGALVFDSVGNQALGGGNIKVHPSTAKSAQASPSKLAR